MSRFPRPFHALHKCHEDITVFLSWDFTFSYNSIMRVLGPVSIVGSAASTVGKIYSHEMYIIIEETKIYIVQIMSQLRDIS